MKYIRYDAKAKTFKTKTEEFERLAGNFLGYSRQEYEGEYGLTHFFIIHLKEQEEFQVSFTYTYNTLFLLNKLLTVKPKTIELVVYKDDVMLVVNGEHPKAKFKWAELGFKEGWNRAEKSAHKDKIIAKWSEKLEELFEYKRVQDKPEDKQEATKTDDLPF